MPRFRNPFDACHCAQNHPQSHASFPAQCLCNKHALFQLTEIPPSGGRGQTVQVFIVHAQFAKKSPGIKGSLWRGSVVSQEGNALGEALLPPLPLTYYSSRRHRDSHEGVIIMMMIAELFWFLQGSLTQVRAPPKASLSPVHRGPAVWTASLQQLPVVTAPDLSALQEPISCFFKARQLTSGDTHTPLYS